MLSYKLCYQPLKVHYFIFFLSRFQNILHLNKTAFFFAKFEIIILEMKGLLSYAFIWNFLK